MSNHLLHLSWNSRWIVNTKSSWTVSVASWGLQKAWSWTRFKKEKKEFSGSYVGKGAEVHWPHSQSSSSHAVSDAVVLLL